MIEHVKLNTGFLMPKVGLGTFGITDFEACRLAVLRALDAGYRLIDTAQVYRNERAVGQALRQSDVPRNEIFVTTKVWLPFYGDHKTADSVEQSLKRLRLDYLDLVLLHEPFGDYYGAYRDLERLVDSGQIKSIGVSNFDEGQILDLNHQMRITPAVNQIELNLYQRQDSLRNFDKQYQIVTEAWAPLGEVGGSILQQPIVSKIAQQYGKSPAQILLKYLLQLDVVVIPKTTDPVHLQQNINLFDFNLTADDMAQLQNLNKNKWLSQNRHSLSVTKHYQDLIDVGLDY